MNLERERELFEEVYPHKDVICEYDFNVDESKYIPKDCSGNTALMAIKAFNLVNLNAAWIGWKLSASREGYKMAPVEPTNYMKCCVRDFDPDIWDYENMNKYEWENLCGDIYKAMIGAVE